MFLLGQHCRVLAATTEPVININAYPLIDFEGYNEPYMCCFHLEVSAQAWPFSFLVELSRWNMRMGGEDTKTLIAL
jgi:hypothetical protein